MIRVAILDDQTIFVHAMHGLLGHMGFEVVLAETSGPGLLTHPLLHRVEVLLLDLFMPGMDGFEVMDRLRTEQPHIKIIILSCSIHPEDIKRSFQCGAHTYADKYTDRDKLSDFIRQLHRGICSMDDHVRRAIGERRADHLPALSEREAAVLRLVCAGKSNREIAEKIILSEGRVAGILETLRDKLDVRSKPQMIVRARELGLWR